MGRFNASQLAGVPAFCSLIEGNSETDFRLEIERRPWVHTIVADARVEYRGGGLMWRVADNPFPGLFVAWVIQVPRASDRESGSVEYVEVDRHLLARIRMGLRNPRAVAAHATFLWRNYLDRFHPYDDRLVPTRSRIQDIAEAVGDGLVDGASGYDAGLNGSQLLAWLNARARKVQPLGFPPYFALKSFKLEALYRLCRLLRPEVVVETGVANGASTACILKALNENRHGELWSIDRPPVNPGLRSRVGSLVDEDLVGRWHLLLADSLRGLREVLDRVGTVNLFLHDSEHTHSRMTHEFRLVWPRIGNPGLLLSDDIKSNSGFLEFCGKVDGAVFVLRGELGILVKGQISRSPPRDSTPAGPLSAD